MSKRIALTLNRDQMKDFGLDLELPHYGYTYTYIRKFKIFPYVFKPQHLSIVYDLEPRPFIRAEFKMSLFQNKNEFISLDDDQVNELFIQNRETEKTYIKKVKNFINKNFKNILDFEKSDIWYGGQDNLTLINLFYTFNLENTKNVEYQLKFLKYRLKYDF